MISAASPRGHHLPARERENHLRERVRKAYGTIRARKRGIPMKAKLQRVECDEEDLIEVPDSWIPVRLEHNAYATPARKAYTLYYLERA